jgi:uncharacterized protein (TIGR03067 family)
MSFIGGAPVQFPALFLYFMERPMRWKMPVFAVVLSMFMIVSALVAADDVPKGLEKAQGAWTLAALTVEGKEIKDAKGKLTVKGDAYTFMAGDTVNKGVYKVDPSKTPMTLDIICKEGPDKGKTLPAIYEVTGDTMKVCLNIKGKDRPKEFASKPDSGTVLESWKKVKE